MVARRDFTVQSGPLAGRHFDTEYQYQQAKARSEGLPSYYAEKTRAANRQGWESASRREAAGEAGREAHAKALGYASEADLKGALRDPKSFLHSLVESRERKRGAIDAAEARRGLKLNAEMRAARKAGDRGNRQGSSLDKLLKWSGRKRQDDRRAPGDTPKPKKGKR